MTVLLTSHYMADVTALASRVLVIDHGALRYDGNLRALVEQTAPYKLLRLTLQQEVNRADLETFGEVQTIVGLEAILRVPRSATKRVAADVLERLPVDDVMIEEPPIEDIIREVFKQGATHG